MSFKPYVLAAYSESPFDLTPGGDGSPAEGDMPPAGDGSPAEGDTPPAGDGDPVEGGTPPAGDNDPAEGGTPPAEDIVTGGEMQEILEGLRESLSQKDADVETLAGSVRSLVDALGTEEAQASDVYVPPEIPFAGYEAWGYPITVDYLVSIVGFGDPVAQTEVYDSPAVFLEDYQNFAKECFLGSTFKDFSIEKICDSGGVAVYDPEAGETEPPEEEPGEDLHPAMLETLASMDAHLAAMDSALADISSISENSIAYYENGLKLYRQANELATHTLAVDLALLFVLVLMLGHRIAHAFWQRMKVG